MYDKICQECEQPFQSVAKKAIFCGEQCRWTHHNRARKDMTAYGDVQKDMPTGKRRVTGRGARAKGAKAERDVCHLIEGLTGDVVARNLEQSRDGGHDVDWGPFAIEVKSQQTVAMPAWQNQVIKSVEGTGKVPSVAWRRRGEEFWIALPMQQFVEIFNTLRRAAEAGMKKNE